MKGIATKNLLCLPLVYLFLAAYAAPLTFADTIVLKTGRTLTGTVVRTNEDDVLVVMDCAAFNFSRGSIKEIKPEQLEATQVRSTNRLAVFKVILQMLAKQAWASDIRPIPATVIDKGILRNVPYVSFQCGGDYEVNVYGDLEHPAGVEIGIYRKLLADDSAKSNCVNFEEQLMGRPADREIIRGLAAGKDLKRQGGLTFEITPPTAEDAYMGWWVSTYSESALDLARASEEEMKKISMPRTEAERQARAGDPTSWSAQDLKLGRQALPTAISFTSKSGSVVTNAQVVRVNDGVSLVWRDGASGGVVRLADLPEDLRAEFGYDAAKTQASDVMQEARIEHERQEAQALAGQASNTAVNSTSYDAAPYSGSSVPFSRSYGSRSLSTGGSVYVHGYTRSNGSYVQGYTRSAPRRR